MQNKIKSTNKIPEYAKDFKNEWLFIRGINKTCGKFVKRLNKLDFTDGYNEEVFFSPLAKRLMEYFTKFLRSQKLGYLKNISDLYLYFKCRDFELIQDLYVTLYDIVVTLNESSFFQDFFESFIVFYYNLNLKNFDFIESDSEIDYNIVHIESDSDSVSDSD